MKQYLRFKQLREKAELNQKEAADKLGIPGYVLSNYELGRSEPKIETLVKMCYLYRCDANELLGVSRPYALKGITPKDPDEQREENEQVLENILKRLSELEEMYKDKK